MQYICSKTGDEGSIYAAKQGMRACNNNNMRNPHNKRDIHVGRGYVTVYYTSNFLIFLFTCIMYTFILV